IRSPYVFEFQLVVQLLFGQNDTNLADIGAGQRTDQFHGYQKLRESAARVRQTRAVCRKPGAVATCLIPTCADTGMSPWQTGPLPAMLRLSHRPGWSRCADRQ